MFSVDIGVLKMYYGLACQEYLDPPSILVTSELLSFG